MHNETPLKVSANTSEEATLTPGELKALIAQIRMEFNRPLPD